MARLRLTIALATAAVGAFALSGAALAATTPRLAPGVFFENDGTILGWDNPNPHPQWNGVIKTVDSPTYKGPNAIMAQQTYVKSNGTRYHSEVVHAHVQSQGQDRWYGEAVYLPPDWVFHNQPVCFEQWAGENPGGPWLLMEINGHNLQYLMGHYHTVIALDNLRGTWIRVVTHIHLAHQGGLLEIWVNGQKLVTQSGNISPNRATTLRWSTGLYETYWFRQKPTGPHQLTLWLDHFREASSYALAEPANW
jgi:polysaccharide lyase-like protein